jgi:hypothetical protein
MLPRAKMLVTAAPPINKQLSVMIVIAFDKQNSVRGCPAQITFPKTGR